MWLNDFWYFFLTDSVEKLDIGYNELGREGCEGLLSKLEPSRLIELKMAATGENSVREVALFLEQRDPCSLISLDLSYCSADDNDIAQLIRYDLISFYFLESYLFHYLCKSCTINNEVTHHLYSTTLVTASNYKANNI